MLTLTLLQAHLCPSSHLFIYSSRVIIKYRIWNMPASLNRQDLHHTERDATVQRNQVVLPSRPTRGNIYRVSQKMSFLGKTAVTTFKIIQNAKVGGVLENSGYLLPDGH